MGHLLHRQAGEMATTSPMLDGLDSGQDYCHADYLSSSQRIRVHLVHNGGAKRLVLSIYEYSNVGDASHWWSCMDETLPKYAQVQH